jgi:hypothetical protein
MTENGPLYVTVGMIAQDPARSADLYSLAFGIEPVLGLTQFFGSDVSFHSSGATLEGGSITYNFYAPHERRKDIRIWSFVPVVSRDLAASMEAAVAAGFARKRDVGIDDKVMPGLRHGLLSDLDGNLVVVLAEDDLKRVLVRSAPSEA